MPRSEKMNPKDMLGPKLFNHGAVFALYFGHMVKVTVSLELCGLM